ncbi:hypothetical protein [uncultured Paludibaculum sp.]|uniref:hypothetical protein n=1 Tax=uncultured Paludibaculum sp. TaxID=1765020 RepID=UPI002AAAAE10|nr:hypothetical protein [uncultured Paludibaculum sp.]
MTQDYNRVMRLAPLSLMLVAAQLLRAQYDPKAPLTTDLILLARIKSVVSTMMARMPNFTCVETIERSRREQTAKKFELLDTIRMEVALVDGKELYAWPGAKRFEESDIRRMVGGSGAIGTGDFALHAKSIFLSGQAKFEYRGTEVLNGRKAHKFHFRVDMNGSYYLMRVGTAEGEVGYQGHVWNDAETLDLMRLEMDIDQIPPQVPLKQGHKLLDYAPMQIGGESYILPSGMDMSLTGMDGTESRNRATFSGCRQYAGESTLIFEDPPPDTAAPKPVPATISLPEGVSVQLKLVAAIDLRKSVVGDTVKFQVAKAVEKAGAVLLPKGAEVEMRIDMAVCRDFPTGHCFLALVPGQVSQGNASGAFHAKLEFPALDKQLDMAFVNVRPEMRLPPAEIAQASPGASILLLRGSRAKLSSGFNTTWRTLEGRGDDKP